MKRMIFSGAIGLATLALVCGTAEAADFTFNVPVDAQNVEAEFTEGRVACVVEGIGNELGTGEQFFALDSFGNFQETLVILVNVVANVDPLAVRGYRCNLTMRNSSGQFVDYLSSTAESGTRGRASGTTQIGGQL